MVLGGTQEAGFKAQSVATSRTLQEARPQGGAWEASGDPAAPLEVPLGSAGRGDLWAPAGGAGLGALSQLQLGAPRFCLLGLSQHHPAWFLSLRAPQKPLSPLQAQGPSRTVCMKAGGWRDVGTLYLMPGPAWCHSQNWGLSCENCPGTR